MARRLRSIGINMDDESPSCKKRRLMSDKSMDENKEQQSMSNLEIENKFGNLAIETNQENQSSNTYQNSGEIAENSENQADKGESDEKPKNPLKDVVAYVEVRSGRDDCTSVFQRQLHALGATTMEKFNRFVTHVVFKDGRKSTYERAIKTKVHLVSVLWVNACKLCGEHVPEQSYPAIVSEVYTSPFGRPRKLKSWRVEGPDEIIPKSPEYYERKRQLREWRINKADLWKPTSLPTVLARILSEQSQTPKYTKVSLPLTPKTEDASCDSQSQSSEDGIQPLARRLFDEYPDLPSLVFSTGYKWKGEAAEKAAKFTARSPSLRIEDLGNTGTSNLPNALVEIDDNVSVNKNSAKTPTKTKSPRNSLDDFKLPKKEIKSKTPLMGPKITLTSFPTKESEAMRKMICKLGGFTVSNTVDRDTSHLVCGAERRTLNVIHAITKACWILNCDWVNKSSESGKWLPEDEFEMSAKFPAAKIYRLEKFQNGPDYKSELFKDFGPIFISPNSQPPEKELRRLLTAVSATIVNNHRQASVILGTAMKNCFSLCAKETWALDCITNAKIMPIDDYLLISKCKDALS